MQNYLQNDLPAAAVQADNETFAPSREDKLFRTAKRACVFLAGLALTFSIVDILEIRSLGAATSVWHLRVKPALASLVVADDGVDVHGTAIAYLPRQETSKETSKEFRAEKPLPNAPIAIREPVVTPREKIVLREPVQPAPRSEIKPSIPLSAPIFASLPEPENAGTFIPKNESRFASVSVLTPVPAAAPDFIPSAQPAFPSLTSVPLPRPAPEKEEGMHGPTPAEQLGLDKDPKSRAKAERCLANAVYFESRSEPVRGQIAVAQVVMNRVFSPFYPKDVCSVVYQNAHRRLACQFTFACDGKSKAIHDRGSWARANRIAKQTLDGKIWLPEVAKSTHYHAMYVKPNWIREMKRYFKTGLHLFYRPYNWGDGSDEPGWVKPPGTVVAATAEPAAKKTRTANAMR